MTVPQAVLLLAYTSLDRLTIGQLADDSGLTFEYVCSCLRALLDAKILRTETINVSILRSVILVFFSETSTPLKLKCTSTWSLVLLAPEFICSLRPSFLASRNRQPLSQLNKKLLKYVISLVIFLNSNFRTENPSSNAVLSAR